MYNRTNEKQMGWNKFLFVTNLLEIVWMKRDKHKRKAKQKPALTHKQKKMRLKWAKETQCVDNWMKVIFTDEFRICINQHEDAEISIFSHWNKTLTTWNKQINFMSFKLEVLKDKGRFFFSETQLAHIMK